MDKYRGLSKEECSGFAHTCNTVHKDALTRTHKKLLALSPDILPAICERVAVWVKKEYTFTLLPKEYGMNIVRGVFLSALMHGVLCLSFAGVCLLPLLSFLRVTSFSVLLVIVWLWW